MASVNILVIFSVIHFVEKSATVFIGKSIVSNLMSIDFYSLKTSIDITCVWSFVSAVSFTLAAWMMDRVPRSRLITVLSLAYVLGLTILVIGGVIEQHRRGHNEDHEKIKFNAFFLLPQGVLFTMIEEFMVDEIGRYFKEYDPAVVNSTLATVFYKTAIGVGSITNVVFIEILNSITRARGRSWFGKDLNPSRVDRFYWVLATAIGAYFILYSFIAHRIMA